MISQDIAKNFGNDYKSKYATYINLLEITPEMEITGIIDDLSMTINSISIGEFDETHNAAFTNEFFPRIVKIMLNRRYSFNCLAFKKSHALFGNWIGRRIGRLSEKLIGDAIALKRIFSPKKLLYDFSLFDRHSDNESDYIYELKSYQTVFEDSLSIVDRNISSKLTTFGYLVNSFGRAKGFATIFEILTKSHLDCNELPVIIRLIKTVANIAKFVDFSTYRSHCLNIAEAAILYVKSIKDEELKKIPEKHLKKLIEQIKRLYEIEGIQSKTQDTDALELEIAWRLCTLPSIERQLTGIGIISEKIAGLTKSKNMVTKKIIMNWLSEKNFDEILLSENNQVEKIQKGLSILRFMYIEKLISGNGLLNIWDNCLSKPNNVQGVIHDSFKELTLHFTTKNAYKLFEKIKGIPLNEFTFHTTDLLISLAKNEYYRNRNTCWEKDSINNAKTLEVHPVIPEDDTENNEPLFIIADYLWTLLQEKALVLDLTPEVQNQTIEAYLKFAHYYYPQRLLEHLKFCEDVIAKDQSVLHYSKIYMQIRDILKEANQNQNGIKDLSQIVMINIIQFKCKAVQKGLAHEKDLSDFFEILITNEIPKLSYYADLEKRLTFLQYLLANNSQKTQYRLFNKLLDAFTFNGITSKEIDIFLQFILYILGSSIGLSFISEGVFDSFFFDFLLKFDLKTFSTSAFQCFKELFIGMNEIYRHIEINESGELEFISPDLIGLDAIWEIVLVVEDQKIYKNASELLLLIYKMKKPYKEERRIVYESFVTRCINYIKKAIEPNNTIENIYERINRILKLLVKQIESSEERSFEKMPKQILMCSFIVNALGNFNKKVAIQVNPIMTINKLIGRVENEICSFNNKYEGNGVLLNASNKTLYECNITQPYTIKKKDMWESNLNYGSSHNDSKENEEEKVSESDFKKIKDIFPDHTQETIKEALIHSKNDASLAIERMTENHWIEKFKEYAEERKKEKLQQSSNRKPEQLSYFLSNNDECFEVLYNLLDSTNLEIALNSWHLLSNIPLSSKFVNDTLRFQLNEEAMEFKFNSHFKILYNLHIIKAIMNSDIPSSQEWIEDFIYKGRLAGICSILLNFTSVSNQIPETFDLRMQIVENTFFICENFVKYSLDELDHVSYNSLMREQNASGSSSGNANRNFNSRIYLSKEAANAILGIMREKKIVGLINKILVDASIEKSGTTFTISTGASLLIAMFCLDSNFIIEAEKDEKFAQFIKNIMIYSQQNDMKTSFITQLNVLFSLCEDCDTKNEDLVPPNVFCLNLLIANLPLPTEENINFDLYFNFIAKHINLASKSELSKYIAFDKKEVVLKLIQYIQSKFLKDTKSINENKQLNGYIALLAGFLELDRFLFESIKPNIETDLLDYLCYAIFGISGKTSIIAIRKYSKDIVEIMCKLLLTCAKHSNEMLLKIFSYLASFHDKLSKQSIKDLDQNIIAKAESGYVGLKNLGCTCYINSLLQQIFMMPQIKNQILELPTAQLEKIKGDKVFLNLQKIFTGLQFSKQQYFTTEDFCKNFIDYEGKPINVRVQQDVGEFFNALAEKMESELKSLEFKQFFSDDLEIEIDCDIESAEPDLEFHSEKEEKHLCLPLDIKGKKNIQDALDYLVKEEILEGENKYFCSEKNRLIKATKKCTFKKIPNTVILNLKRFEYDLVSKLRKKLNDYCEFPETLNFYKWTKEGQKKKSEEKPRALDYDLVGVIIHIGTAEGGHYFSYCKERNANSPNYGKWFEFNDTRVAPFDIANLKTQAFGILDANKAKAMNDWENDSNAYLLVYQKAEQLVKKEEVKLNTEKYDMLLQQENENRTNARIYVDDNYKDFLFDFLALVHPDPIASFSINESAPNELRKIRDNPDNKPNELVDPNGAILIPSSISLTVCKIAAKYNQDLISKTSAANYFNNWMTILRNHTEVNALTCVWLIKWLTANPAVLYKFLLESSNEHQRKEFSKLIWQVLTLVAGIESSYLTEEAKISSSVEYLSSAARFIKLMITEGLTHSRPYWRQFAEFFEVMIPFAGASPQNVAVFAKEGAIYSLIDFVANTKESLNKNKNSTLAKERKEMGDMHLSETKTFLKEPLTLLSILICSSSSSAMREAKTIPPTSLYPLEKLINLKEDDAYYFCLSNWKYMALLENYNKELTQILLHLMWEDKLIQENVAKDAAKDLMDSPYIHFPENKFKFIKDFLGVKDSLVKYRFGIYIKTKNYFNKDVFTSLIDWKNYNVDICLNFIFMLAEFMENDQIVEVLKEYKLNLEWVPNWLSNDTKLFHKILDKERKEKSDFISARFLEKLQIGEPALKRNKEDKEEEKKKLETKKIVDPHEKIENKLDSKEEEKSITKNIEKKPEAGNNIVRDDVKPLENPRDLKKFKVGDNNERPDTE